MLERVFKKDDYYITQHKGNNFKINGKWAYRYGHTGTDLRCYYWDCYVPMNCVAYSGYDRKGYGKYIRFVNGDIEIIYAHLSQVNIIDGGHYQEGD